MCAGLAKRCATIDREIELEGGTHAAGRNVLETIRHVRDNSDDTEA
jgi:hypothetical protein